jgi:hypothetical protein
VSEVNIGGFATANGEASPAKKNTAETEAHGGEAAFGFRRVTCPGEHLVRREFLGGREGGSPQQEQLISFPAVDEYRERVFGIMEASFRKFPTSQCHNNLRN